MTDSTPTATPMTTDSMITDLDGQAVDVATALDRLVAALDRRFPTHNSPAERLSRLLEETGELAEALTTPHRDSVQHSAAVAKELQDVLRSAVAIAHHYGLRTALPNNISTPAADPYTLLAQLVSAAGAVAKAVHHLLGMGLKREKHGDPDLRNLEVAVGRVIDAVLHNATHHGQLDALHTSLQASYRAYQRDNFLPRTGAIDE